MLLPAFQNLTLCLHVSKPKWEGDLMLILCYIKISCASLHNDFVELDKMQVEIQGVKHNLRRIEQIYTRLYNNKDTLGETKLRQKIGKKVQCCTSI